MDRIRVIFLACALAICVVACAQAIFPDVTLKEDFLAQVKSLDEFQARFNGMEKKTGSQMQNDSLTRARNLISLFDRNFNRNGLSKELLLNKVNTFVRNVLEKKVIFDASGEYLWAECCCRFKYKGNNKCITLVMQKEPYLKGTFRWALAAVKGMDTAGIINLNRYYAISPVEHEIHFMGLQDLFNENSSHAFGYRAKVACIDQLSVLLAFIQAGQLKFDMVENLKYHYLGVPGFVFTIEENARRGDNSGWLISSLTAMSDNEKLEYVKTILGNEK